MQKFSFGSPNNVTISDGALSYYRESISFWHFGYGDTENEVTITISENNVIMYSDIDLILVNVSANMIYEGTVEELETMLAADSENASSYIDSLIGKTITCSNGVYTFSE